MSIEELKKVLGPPPIPIATGVDANWEDVEREVGAKIPTDYKNFVSQYGVGCIDEFLWVFNPFTRNEHLNLVRQMKVKLEALQVIREDLNRLRNEYHRAVLYSIPYPLYPEKDGLVPWAGTDNGDVMYLRFASGSLSGPVIVGDSGGEEWAEFDGSVTAFLTSLLSRRFRIDFFPDDFPSEEPVFTVRE